MDEKTHEPLLPILTLIVDTAVKLQKSGHRVVIVSSGAIGVGLRRMDIEKKPKHLAQLQVSHDSAFQLHLSPFIFRSVNNISLTGSCRHWTMSSHEFVGRPVPALGSAYCPNSLDQE